MRDLFRVFAGALLLLGVPGSAGSAANRINLSPKLHDGQTFSYRIGYRAETQTKTESAVAAPMAPAGGVTDEHLQLQGEVEEVRRENGGNVVRLRTWIVQPEAAPAAPPKGAVNAEPAPQSVVKIKEIGFTLHANGQVSGLKGLDTLSTQEQAAWQEWVARFGVAAVFPEKGVRPRQKWKTFEAISSSALAGLQWEKESEYVNDAPCKPIQQTAGGDVADAPPPQETCAVILTTATLRQKSSPKDATPEDYKLHDLRTMGSAKGKNEIITYISLKTGLVVRATEDTKQSMDVVVAKADGSNRVHYNVDAESHAEVLLVADASSKNP